MASATTSAGLLVAEAVRILTGIAPPAALDGVLEVDHVTGATRRRTLLRVPRCPACGPAAPRPATTTATTATSARAGAAR